MENIIALEGNEPIEFVQGDTYTYTLRFNDVDLVDFIEKIVFTCSRYNIGKEFSRVETEDGVQFEIRLENTEDFCPSITTFDITVVFSEGEKRTIVSETGIKFRVHEKKNPVGVGDGV